MSDATQWIDVRRALPWLRGHRVHVVAADREPALRTALADLGFTCLTLDGRGLVDAAGFFTAAARALGRDKGFGANWDALRDALLDLDASATTRVALLWRGADILIRSDLSTFVAAITTFDGAARDLGTLPTDGTPLLQLEVFVLSNGPGVA